MLAAMDIYCELLSAPGVLKPDDLHLLEELRLLRDSSGKLLDRLLVEALRCLASSDQKQEQRSGQDPALLDDRGHMRSRSPSSLVASAAASVATPGAIPSAVLYDPADDYSTDDRAAAARRDHSVTVAATVLPPREGGKRVANVLTELQANLPMLSALAGPRVHVSLDVATCPEAELFMPPVDLTRVLINLVRNAAEAMSIGGRILIAATSATMPGSAPGPSPAIAAEPASQALAAFTAEETQGATPAVMISIEDNGPGIPLSLLDRIFDLQISNATQEESLRPRMQFRPRGLGLRIVRDFVEASGGSVRALRLRDRGSRFEIVLPMVTVNVTQVGSGQ